MTAGKFDDLAKSRPKMVLRKKLQMQGAQKLRSEVPEGLAPQGPHKKVEAQRRRWTFYETIKFNYSQRMKSMNGNAQIVEGVQRDKAGVGYVAVGYVVTESGEVKVGIKILNVAKDEKSEAFSPAKMENVITGKYPISCPLNQYLNGCHRKTLRVHEIPGQSRGPGDRAS